VLVLGMHRSGTSAVTRGLAALSVHLGENFFETAPDNPTGYWEDRSLVAINQRVLGELRLKWDDTQLVGRAQFRHHRIRLLQLHAVRYLENGLAAAPVWGFKDPRTIRLLPFWPDVLRKCGAQDAYVLAIRHPLSVASSLYRRQEIGLTKGQHLWLVHNVPFLQELRDRPFVVVDYDLLAQAPHTQLERLAGQLGLPAGGGAHARQIDLFANGFLDGALRHNVFSIDDFETATDAGRLARQAYLLLYDLATDRRQADGAFWFTWSAIEDRLKLLRSEEVDRSA
jgi:hypothetical protein